MGSTRNSDDDKSLDDEHDEDEDDLILGLQTPNPVIDIPPILPDVEMTSVDQTVTSETFWKKDKQKARVTDNKQVKNQSTTANPVQSGAHAFKIIQTSKGRRKLVAYFENWETTLKALDTPLVSSPSGKELKWCRHSIPNLKKAHSKLKTKNTPDKKKSGKTGKAPVSNQSKKKDKQQSSK
ncbi:unnamed protein product [Rhizophagus irregularis]|nr:unnamed protein product [Rhizophagus irregularis]